MIKIFILSTIFSFAHDFHVSKLDLNYNTETQSLEMSLHVFLDDLEKALSAENSTAITLFTTGNEAIEDSMLTEYISEYLDVNLGEEKLDFIYVGKEMSDDLSAAYIYLEIPKVKEASVLNISNSILFEHFDDQSNIVQCRTNRKLDQYLRLDKKKQTGIWSL